MGDESSALARSVTPGLVPQAHQLAVDQLNATMLLNHNIRAVHGDKRLGKFSPVRTYPGSPFEPQKPVTLLDPNAEMGGYRKMTPAATVEWLRSRGLPAPAI